MARSIHCSCDSNFTCGYCLRNAPPWVWTPSVPESFYEYCVRKNAEEAQARKIEQAQS